MAGLGGERIFPISEAEEDKSMSVTDQFVAQAQRYEEGFDQGGLPMPPVPTSP